MQVLCHNFELSSNMSGIIEQLFRGSVKYSRRQLYELLSLLREIYDVGVTRDGNGSRQRKAMLESQWWPKIIACLRRLSNLARTSPTESPSVEAHEAIAALKLLALRVRGSFDGEGHAETSLQGQHNNHPGILSEHDENRCSTVKFTFGHTTARRTTSQVKNQVPRARLKRCGHLSDLRKSEFRRSLGNSGRTSQRLRP